MILQFWKKLSRPSRPRSRYIGSSLSEPTIHLPYWIEVNPRKGSETSYQIQARAVSRDRTTTARSNVKPFPVGPHDRSWLG